MILQRLYELALREKLLDDPAFERAPVKCLIVLSEQGQFLGLRDVRERVELPARGKNGKPKLVLRGGKSLPVPVRPVIWDEKQRKWKLTDPAAAGKEKPAVFLADTLARVLPLESLVEEKDRAKFQAQRSTFRRFLSFAASQSENAQLLMLAEFLQRLAEDIGLQETIAVEIKRLGLALADLCTFEISDDEGQTILQSEPILDWWRKFHAAETKAQLEGEVLGPCQVTQEITGIASSVKTRISGLIPVGCRAEAYLVTGLPAAESYMLSGAQASMVSARGIDGFTRALNALIANQTQGKTTSYRTGRVQFAFWTREACETGVNNLFDPDPQEVQHLLRSVDVGKQSFAVSDTNALYVLVLSGNLARVVVRDFLETTLPRVQQNLAAWFLDLRIVDLSREGAGQPSNLFSLNALAAATIPRNQDGPDWKQLAPETPARLLHAALTGAPVPESLLVSCVRRLRAEGREGFRASRLALIKLILTRKEIPVSETLNADEKELAYLCGRLLSVFEQIQFAALGEVNANVVDKFYGTFSAAPARLFARLVSNAQNHLRKLRGDKPGAFVSNDRRLSEILRLMGATPPPAQFSLQEQGRFALGYYHEKAKRFEEIAARKNEKAEEAARDEANS